MARRTGRVLWSVLIVLVILAVGADIAARLAVQNMLASRLRSELALSEEPDVSLHGIPFLLYLLRERFPSADIEARGVEAEGLRVRRLLLEVEDVRFSTKGGVVRAARGSGEAQVSGKALTAFLEAQGVPVRVRFPGGRVDVSAEVAGEEIAVTGTLELEDGVLVFTPEELGDIPTSAFSFEVELPDVVEGVRYRDLTIADGAAVLSVRLSGSILRVVV
ncbi:MAG TPA: DUF2993 domain-containing protein [Actinomycetota bacterium]|nr:DUF2993 domain-containing protein [Actinomycetota bacterium]